MGWLLRPPARGSLVLLASVLRTFLGSQRENEAQLAFLRLKDCDLIQGYLISAAVPAEALAAMLDARQPLIVANARNRSR